MEVNPNKLPDNKESPKDAKSETTKAPEEVVEQKDDTHSASPEDEDTNEQEEKNQEVLPPPIPPPPAIPSPSENPVCLVDSSFLVFNEEYNKLPVVIKCGKTSCKNTLYIRKCSTPQCGKLRCYHCIHLLYKKLRLPLLLIKDPNVNPTHNKEVPVCTKGCYNVVKKILDKSNNARIPWNKDGCNSEDDPNNSDSILINWLIAEGNYRRYRGDVGHHKKVGVVKKVADIINAAGVRCKRTGKQVQSKIEHLEACFKNAYFFANSETGAGLKEKDEGNFEDECLCRCPHYFDLFDVMADRPGVKPVSTSDEHNNSSNLNNESDKSGIDENDLDEQQRIADMAFDGESENERSNDNDDNSSSSSSKHNQPKKTAKRILPTHPHRTPPRKAKKLHPTHMHCLVRRAR